MLFEGIYVGMLTCLNRLSGILSKFKPLRCLLSTGLTEMVPVDRVRSLSVDLGRVPFGDTKTKWPMMRNRNPKISIKIRIDVRMHVSTALNSTKKDEIDH